MYELEKLSNGNDVGDKQELDFPIVTECSKNKNLQSSVEL